jgi:tetratricopeptide (TPR) repeat protein
VIVARGLILLLVALSADASDIQSLISALRAQNYEEALALAKELKTKNASDPRVWTLEGLANEKLNNTTEALRDYRSALKIKPDYLPALKAEAQLEYANADKEAGKILERILKLEPADQVSHAMLAALAYKQGNCQLAVAQYRQSSVAIAAKPDALTQYGECLLKREQADEAASVLAQVVALEPSQWWPRYNLASAQLVCKKASEAIKTIEPVLNTASVQPQMLDLAAEAYETLGDTPRAVELLRKAILARPKDEDYYLHFADLCFDHASFRVGIDMINAGLTQLPESAKLYLARGVLWGQLGDFAKAESDFDHADHLDGQGAIGGAAASLAELQNSNLDKALRLARTKLQTNPQDPMLYYVKAETLKQMGVEAGTPEFREALDSAVKAVRFKPDFAAAQNLLGALYMQENRFQLASQQFQAVLKKDPGDQTALYHLIQVSRKTGRSEDVPRLIKQLAQAKIKQRQRDEIAGRYRLVEAQGLETGH